MSDKENKDLSDRELEIIRLVAAGASNKEIAQRLVISANTVKVHLRNIFDKIDVSSRTEAAMYAVTNGLVETLASPSEEVSVDGSDEFLNSEAEGKISDLKYGFLKRKQTTLTYTAWFFSFVIVILLIIWFNNRSLPEQAPLGGQLEVSSSERWSDLSEIPTPRSSFAVSVFENKVYAIGGEVQQGVTDQVERYDPEIDQWESVAPKPLPVADIATVVIGGLIYVPGGRTDSGDPTDRLEVYDPWENSWMQKSNLPEPLCAYSLSSFEGRLYLFGGWNGKKFVDTVYAYDPFSDEWTERTPMPTARGYASAVEAGGQIFVMGGYNGDEYLRVNEVYSPIRDNANDHPWTSATQLPDGRYGFGATNLADVIYVVGGETENPEALAGLIFFPQENEWRSFESSDQQLGSYLGLASLGVNLFAIGGKVDEMVTGKNQVYRAMYTISMPVLIK